jgi:hypothetical protein
MFSVVSQSVNICDPQNKLHQGKSSNNRRGGKRLTATNALAYPTKIVNGSQKEFCSTGPRNCFKGSFQDFHLRLLNVSVISNKTLGPVIKFSGVY